MYQDGMFPKLKNFWVFRRERQGYIMKKQILLRGFLGFPIGIMIGDCISIVCSLFWGNGQYSPCEPRLVEAMGNEIYAVIVQSVLCGLLGTGFSASSVIWEIDHWSLMKQTGIYFAVNTFLMMPIAYGLFWMEHSIRGFGEYLGIFVMIFVVIWVSRYVARKRDVKNMNAGLNRTRE